RSYAFTGNKEATDGREFNGDVKGNWHVKRPDPTGGVEPAFGGENDGAGGGGAVESGSREVAKSGAVGGDENEAERDREKLDSLFKLHSDCEECFSDPKLGLESAKLLEESGGVIVLGNLVFLRPEQVAKAVGGLIPLQRPNPNDPRIKQLLEMETQKAKIDSKANSLVRRELWVGLVYLVVQTAGFMRLTFWELSWDVMEPVCFFFTSMYFMAAYTFFLKTSKEPSFEGFYQSRFTTKQKRLIRAHNFDMEKYDKLKSMFYPHS
ncbi:hypothetical protein V6Z11_1Z026400, partial [Gossypium hirsutum]